MMRSDILTLEMISRLKQAIVEPSAIRPTPGGYYFLHIPAKNYAYFVMIQAKARWREQYRAERIARRQGCIDA